MLFGEETFTSDVLRVAQQFAEDNNIKLVYGAVVGGISKGVQYADSDYDTRFLYISEDFPNKIIIPREHKETEFIKRFYAEEDWVCEWLPFWEMSSFLQFLVDPCIDHKMSFGLCNVVNWTFGSPYNWDPYGIQSKIRPIMDQLFCARYLIEFYLEQIDLYYNDAEIIVAKDYIYATYAALVLDWIMKHNSFPPVYILTLLADVDNEELVTKIKRLIKLSREHAKYYMNTEGKGMLHSAHYNVFCKHNNLIDHYISDARVSASKMLSDKENIVEISASRKDNLLISMYSIIEASIHEEPVKNISTECNILKEVK